MKRIVGAKKLTAAVLGLALASSLVACAEGGEGEGGGEGTLKLGVPLGLTGPAAGTGDWDRMGVELSVAAVNAAGGIDGREVEAIFVDTELDPANAVTAVTRLINEDEIDFLVGPMTSDETLATLPALTKANIPTISGAGSMLDPQVAPYTFGMLLNIDYQAEKMVEYAVSKFDAKNVAVINYSAAQGKAGYETIAKSLDEEGIDLVAHQEYDIPVSDLSAQLLAIKKADPELILIVPQTGNDTGIFIKAMREAGMSVPVIGSYASTYSGQAKSVAGEDAYQDFYSVNWPGFSACTVDDVRAEAVDFIDEVKSTYSEDRTRGAAFDNIASFYDGLWLLKAGVEGSGSLDGDKVSAWLAENGTEAAKEISVIHDAYALSADSRFLMNTDSITLVDAGTEVVPGILQRVDGC